MTKEKRLEALAWLIDQAEAVQSGITGIKMSDDIDIRTLQSDPTIPLFGNGFYELARAASQVVHTDPEGTEYRKEYFNFDGVVFYRYYSGGRKDG